jgi:hypothetical protein
MTTRFPRQEQFDRDRSFTVRQPVTVSGRFFSPGEPFDKTLVTTRRLRQMFEQRRLIMSGESEVAEVVVQSPRPDFSSLPAEAILSWLEARDIVPRIGTPHERLVERANEEWDRRHPVAGAAPQGFVIPKDWLQLNWFVLCKKVEELTGHRPANKAELIEMVRTGRIAEHTMARAA